MKGITSKDVVTFIGELEDPTVLRELNSFVVGRIKELQREQARSFKSGDKVEFVVSNKRGHKAYQNGRWVGEVVSARGRRVSVLARHDSTDPGSPATVWKVSGSMLERYKPLLNKEVEGKFDVMADYSSRQK